MGVLLYELGELYSANRRGVPCALPEPMSFRGYAQREAVEQRGPQFAVAEEYWVKQFSDCVPVLELPSDRPRPARRTYAGSHRACSLKPELAAALRRFSAERNCTTFTTLLALFEVLLHRSSPVVGSSRNSTCGRPTRLAARSSRRRIPPEYVFAERSAASDRPKRSRMSALRRRAR